MANTLNLDRSQRLDVVCKRGDTFKMNLELKDDDGVAIDLNAVTGAVSSTNPLYVFKMEVRAADTDDVAGTGAGGHLIQKYADIITASGTDTRTATSAPATTTNLAQFKVLHSDMSDLSSGVYVYDIQKHLISTAPSYTSAASTILNELTGGDLHDVETILYGVFTVNEDITL